MFGIVNEQYDKGGDNSKCPQCDKMSKECECPVESFFDIEQT